MTQVHSFPVESQPAPCETTGRLAAVPLRPYVAGYSGFRSGSGGAVRHRVLPLNLATAIVDLTGEARVVTGPRVTPAVFDRTVWRSGVSIGFTPLGVRALLGVPAPELVGRTVPLADLVSGTELVERLAAVSGWSERFALLDELLHKRLALVQNRLAPGNVDPLVAHAWGQLQVDGVRVADLANRLGVSRRYLELGFQRQVGVPPGAVGRIARFQRAVGMLARRTAPLAVTAAECGYADQAHFTREVRAMSGLAPTELFAFLQSRDLVPR